MNLIIPNNIFATMFVLTLEGENKPNVLVRDSSLITKELLNSSDNIALIPSMDLINNRELFVSQKFGISFESPLSNSYIYFPSESEEIKEVLLKGDVASNEVILSKIIFNERYGLKIDIALDSGSDLNAKKTYHICGNENWTEKIYERGSSFAEQVLEITDQPYLNYVLASTNEDLVKEFNKKFDKLNEILLSNLDNYLTKINLESNVSEFIKEEINSVNFDLKNEELEGLEDTIQFIYFNQIIDDLFDIKFV
jgi:hypothetical protein